MLTIHEHLIAGIACGIITIIMMLFLYIRDEQEREIVKKRKGLYLLVDPFVNFIFVSLMLAIVFEAVYWLSILLKTI